MSNFEPNQAVYLPDGREAVYVLQNGDQHLVRVMMEAEGSYDEPPYTYPSDKITPALRLYPKPPIEVWDEQILAKREKVAELDREIAAKRQEVSNAGRKKADMEKAAEKYPCIQEALDFIEGRITHVVKWSGYGAATIHKMPEAFEQVDTWHGRRTHEGMRLLSLFGTDEKGKHVGWGLHQYRDGSGGNTVQIWPARSETEARAKVLELLDAALAAWRSGEEKWFVGNIAVNDTLSENGWIETPADWSAHQKEQGRKIHQQKIEKLREQLAELEATEE